MKTTKQIADELGVDKQKIYRYIKQNNINEAHRKQKVMYYDEIAESQIIKHFQNMNHINEAHQNASNETVIKALLKQLEIKDNEIQRLHGLLEREQQIRMVEAQQKLLPSKWKFWKNRHHDER